MKFEVPQPVVDLYGVNGAREAIANATRRHEQNARDKVSELGWRFLGAARCVRVSPFKRARAYEVFGKRDPTFATQGGGEKAFFAAAQELRAFRRRHREALEAWRRGRREVEFPYGTWSMRVLHGVRCVPAPG